MTTKAEDENVDTKQEAATSQSPTTTTTAGETTNETEPESTSSVDELAQAVGQIHVSSSESEVDEANTANKDEPVLEEGIPEALRKVASWIMDGTVKNILVLTGAGVRYVCVCLGFVCSTRYWCMHVCRNMGRIDSS